MADPFFRELGQRIARLRAERGLTQEAFAARTPLSSSYLARVERGLRRPTLDALRSLAEALAIPVWALLQAGPDSPPSAQAEDLARVARELAPDDLRLLTRLAIRLAGTRERARSESETPRPAGRAGPRVALTSRAAEQVHQWSKPSPAPRRRPPSKAR